MMNSWLRGLFYHNISLSSEARKVIERTQSHREPITVIPSSFQCERARTLYVRGKNDQPDDGLCGDKSDERRSPASPACLSPDLKEKSRVFVAEMARLPVSSKPCKEAFCTLPTNLPGVSTMPAIRGVISVDSGTKRDGIACS